MNFCGFLVVYISILDQKNALFKGFLASRGEFGSLLLECFDLPLDEGHISLQF